MIIFWPGENSKTALVAPPRVPPPLVSCVHIFAKPHKPRSGWQKLVFGIGINNQKSKRADIYVHEWRLCVLSIFSFLPAIKGLGLPIRPASSQGCKKLNESFLRWKHSRCRKRWQQKEKCCSIFLKLSASRRTQYCCSCKCHHDGPESWKWVQRTLGGELAWQSSRSGVTNGFLEHFGDVRTGRVALRFCNYEWQSCNHEKTTNNETHPCANARARNFILFRLKCYNWAEK